MRRHLHFKHGRRLLLAQFSAAMCFLAMCFIAMCFMVGGVSGQERAFRPVTVVSAFPPITQFPVKSVREAGSMLNPSELVLGVTVGKESRAYPINMLTGPQREILNDTLGGRAIMATW